MKTVKDKYLVVGADFAGFPLKEVVVEHLEKKEAHDLSVLFFSYGQFSAIYCCPFPRSSRDKRHWM